jgi:dsDNA-binding SOS-regulon protein
VRALKQYSNKQGAPTMNFTVKHQAGRYDIVSDKMLIDSFDDEQEAKKEAERLNEEYERVLSFL